MVKDSTLIFFPVVYNRQAAYGEHFEEEASLEAAGGTAPLQPPQGPGPGPRTAAHGWLVRTTPLPAPVSSTIEMRRKEMRSHCCPLKPIRFSFDLFIESKGEDHNRLERHQQYCAESPRYPGPQSTWCLPFPHRGGASIVPALIPQCKL